MSELVDDTAEIVVQGTGPDRPGRRARARLAAAATVSAVVVALVVASAAGTSSHLGAPSC